MPARKMRVELFDSEGNKYTIAFEGQMTRDKAVRLLDLMELLGGVQPNGGEAPTSHAGAGNEHTKYEKVHLIIQKKFPLVWFSSKEVQALYEQEFKEPLSLSTAATYLSRLASKGLLAKAGAANSLRYKIMQNPPIPVRQSTQ